MRGTIILDGKKSIDYHIVVEHYPSYVKPQREYTKVSVPGRNGDLLIDTGRYSNVDQTYDVVLDGHEKGFADATMSAADFLSPVGYVRLEDIYNEELFRYACVIDSLDVQNYLNKMGRAKIKLNCKPQRYYKHGERYVKVANGQELINPSAYDATPVVSIEGTGAATIVIGEYTIAISEIGSKIVLDSVLEDAYNEAENKNDKVKLSSNYPVLHKGNTKISWVGDGVTSVKIQPNWWTL